MFVGLFQKEKFKVVNRPEEADIIVINTCGFIESAKEEAIHTILEMAELKKEGKCQYLIATGCLVKRYQTELQKALPEVDLFISVEEYEQMWSKIENLLGLERKSKNTLDYMDRVIATGGKTAYLKIAEGCSNHCTYCAIPSIRGPYHSRPMEAVLREARKARRTGLQRNHCDCTRYDEVRNGFVRRAKTGRAFGKALPVRRPPLDTFFVCVSRKHYR